MSVFDPTTRIYRPARLAAPRLPASLALALVGATAMACAAGDEDAAIEPGPVRAEVELRIAPDGTDSDPYFGRLNDVAAISDGTIFTADWQIPELRRYSADGAFLGVVGRVGEGPGEYSRLAEIEALPDDRVAAWPSIAGRLTLYAPDGAFDTTLPVPSRTLGQRMLAADTEGRLYVRSTEALDAGGYEYRDVMIRVDPGGGEPEPIPMPPPAHEAPGFVVSRPEGHRPNFTVQTLHAWSPLGYVVSGRNDRYEIRLDAPDGPVFLRRELERAALGAEERSNWLAIADAIHNRPPDGFEVGERPTYTVPEIKPYFREIRVDRQGRVWVDRYVEAEYREAPPPSRPGSVALEWIEPVTFDVFSPTGEFLATVLLPPTTRFSQADGPLLWGIQADEEGEDAVVRMRWEAPER